MAAAAQAAIGLREEFLGVAAHELRTPLTTLKGYAQLLARLLGRSELDRDRLTEAHAALERQLGRLERLVADLLDVARIQRGELALQRRVRFRQAVPVQLRPTEEPRQ